MPKTVKLEELLQDLSTAVVRTQERFNDAHLVALSQFRTQLHKAPPEAIGILRPLTPSLQLIRNHETEVTTEFRVDQSIGFSIQARPLNLGYSILHQKKHSAQSRLRLFVDQVVINPSKENE